MATVSAGPKIAGFTYQFHRALYVLFSSEVSAVVGVETEDDVVSVRTMPDGTVEVTFEQDKHSVQTAGQPFEDSSYNLWHTLHIWLEELSTTRSQYACARYCLVTNKHVPLSALARALGDAKSDAQIADCIEKIREAAAGVGGASDTHKTMREVASFPDGDLAYVIKNTELLDAHGTTSGQHPRDATIQLFHLPPELNDKGEEIYAACLGLLIKQCEEAWLARRAAWIDKGPLTRTLQAAIAGARMNRFVEQPFLSVAYQHLMKEHEGSHLFMRQLQHVGYPPDACLRALSHYWAFYAERIRLQSVGDILPSAWDSRDDQLHQRWQAIADQTTLTEVGGDELVLAKKILAKTLDGSYTAPIGGQATTHPYFTHGNYHALANEASYECFVHWHSSFKPERA